MATAKEQQRLDVPTVNEGTLIDIGVPYEEHCRIDDAQAQLHPKAPITIAAFKGSNFRPSTTNRVQWPLFLEPISGDEEAASARPAPQLDQNAAILARLKR
jgi:hypothetical protein